MENLVKTYKGKKVLITGDSGFKGSWLALWLHMLGARVYGFSLEPRSLSLFNKLGLNKLIRHKTGNINNSTELTYTIHSCEPEIIFHLAAQALVGESYENPVKTYETNVMGTLNVLEAAKCTPSVKALINVTTDKCYENQETEGYGYKETDKLGGYDIYSSSKACSEILSASYRSSFLKNGYALATARAGNVIGGGDWADGRLIPDCIRAWEKGETAILRHPEYKRPWQFVLEPLLGYLLIGEKLLNGKNICETAFNFGPDNAQTVSFMVRELSKHFEDAAYENAVDPDYHEAGTLSLDSSKAKNLLGWHPVYESEEALKETALWYKKCIEGADMLEFTKMQVESFMRKADGKITQISC